MAVFANSAGSYASCCNRLGNTDNLLLAIQDKIKWADKMSDLDRKHKKDVEDKAEELRKSIKVSGIATLRRAYIRMCSAPFGRIVFNT
jgi:hypothetical protein